MSQRYKGGVISATPPTTSTSSASGVWTEQQFMQGVASGNWPALAGAPTIGTATAGALSASVAFTAPTYVGSGITGYTATSSPGGITGTGASSPVTVSGLTAGTAYTFTVTATTAAGQGPASAVSNSVTPTLPQYIEEVFSPFAYAGSDSSQTLTDGINRTLGALDWFRVRTTAGENHILWDTIRTGGLETNTTASQAAVGRSKASYITQNDGNVVLNFGGNTVFNRAGENYIKWTFREQAKFFDIQTFTYPSSGSITVNHNLASTPGCVMVKMTDGTDNWYVYHRMMNGGTDPSNYYIFLNSTSGQTNNFTPWITVGSSSITFPSGALNPGSNFVMYLFAHDAGGFGLTGTDNVISCGGVTTDGSGNATVNLGYEPQWILFKQRNAGTQWVLLDNMRGWNIGQYTDRGIYANTTAAEADGEFGTPTSTGFNLAGQNASAPIIYIAIRRGPMKVPTVGTSVFIPITATASTGTTRTVGFPADMTIASFRASAGVGNVLDRLRIYPPTNADGKDLNTWGTFAEGTSTPNVYSVWNKTAVDGGYFNGGSTVWWHFGRAPSFFDVRCYTGTGSATTVAHNLGVVPELMIVKKRNDAAGWAVWSQSLPSGDLLQLNTTDAKITNSGQFTTNSPTSNVFYVGTEANTNQSTYLYVAYLFATCAGVSKVGSYTGTGATQTVNCAFTTGARFVLIKRTDSTGDWYAWDSARGMVSGTDPSLLLNSNAAEVNANSVYTTAVGFQIVSTAAGINASGGNYIFLAIA